MTPEQTRLMLIAKARQRQGAANAQSSAPADAQPQRDYNMGEASQHIGSGFVRGIGDLASMADWVNPLSRVRKMALDGLDYMGVTSPEISAKSNAAFANPNSLIEPMLKAPDPMYASEEKAARFVGGQIIPDVATGGMAAIPMSIGTGVLSSLGDTAGRALAEEYFPGNSWTGEAPPSEDPNNRTWYDYARSWTPGPADVAGIIGGGVAGAAPQATKSGAEAFVHSRYADTPPTAVDPKTGRQLLTDPDYVSGKDVYEAAKRQGIPVTGGMLGNKELASWEQNVAMSPLGGERIKKKMTETNAHMGNRVNAIATDARAVYDRAGNVVLPGAAQDIENLAGNVKALNRDTANGVKEGVSKNYDNMQNQIGDNTPVDVHNVGRIMKKQQTQASVRDVEDIQREAQWFEGDRKAVLDTGLETQLQNDLKIAQGQLKNAMNPRSGSHPSIIKAMEKRVADAQKKIDKNRGTTFEHLKRQQAGIRTGERGSAGQKVSVPDTFKIEADKAITKSMLKTAKTKGVSAKEFRDNRNDYAHYMFEDPKVPLSGAVPKLAAQSEKDVLSNLDFISGGKMSRIENMQLLEHGVEKNAQLLEQQGRRAEALIERQRFRQVMGDTLERAGRVKPGESEAGSQFSGHSFTTNIKGMQSPEAKAKLLGGAPDGAQDLADVVTIGQGARSRGREINASRTQTHNLLSRVFDGMTGNGIPGVFAGIWDAAKGGLIRKPADMALSSEWLPEAVVYGAQDWKRKIGTRAAIGAGVSANASLADQFGGPR
jgi:hypothetical protein